MKQGKMTAVEKLFLIEKLLNELIRTEEFHPEVAINDFNIMPAMMCIRKVADNTRDMQKH